MFGGAPEDARARVSRLGVAGDGANFHEPETEVVECRHGLGVFVETGGQTEWVAEGQAKGLHGTGGGGASEREHFRQGSSTHEGHAEVVDRLRVELEKERADE
jgi:hypothetical protein